MEVKDYIIEIIGCDDSTSFIIQLTEDEYKTIEKISEISEEVSTYQCMPILIISEVELKEQNK